MPHKTPLNEFFWARVTPKGVDDCWLWEGDKGKEYGIVYLGKIKIGDPYKYKKLRAYAHRISWELTNGPIPDGLIVCHKCDVPMCVNPNHLFLGTKKDNTQDMIKKRRHNHGDKVAWSKVTEQEAKEIIASKEKNGVLAEKYGINFRTVSQIRNGTTWKHLH